MCKNKPQGSRLKHDIITLRNIWTTCCYDEKVYVLYSFLRVFLSPRKPFCRSQELQSPWDAWQMMTPRCRHIIAFTLFENVCVSLDVNKEYRLYLLPFLMIKYAEFCCDKINKILMAVEGFYSILLPQKPVKSFKLCFYAIIPSTL